MAVERGVAVRPSGAPMVPMPGLRPGDGGDSEGTGDAREAVVQAGQALADDAKEAGGRLAGEARDRARSEMDRRSTEAGERVAGAAGDVRGVAQHLREQGRDGPARLADEAAGQIDRFAAYLREADGDTILADARDLGLRRPVVLVAGAAVVGIMAGRFLRASEPAGRGVTR